MRFVKRLSPPVLLIIAAPWLLFWPWLLRGRVLFWGTLLFQFWPWHQLVKASLLAGKWPLWNPLLGNGTPLLANLQSAVLYPPNLLYLLVPVEHGLTLSVMLHLTLAGLFMYRYARHIGLTPFAAAVSALSYMFSGYLVGRTQFVSMVNAAAWIPLLLLLCDRLVTRRGYLTVLRLALGLAVQLLAGHAQLWFYTVCLIGAYTLFRAWQQNRQRGLLGATWRLATAGGLALLLAAGQVWPTLELVLQSPRSGGAGRAFALSYSYWPWRFFTLLAPNFFGHPAQGNYWGYANYWEDHAYIGLLPLLLALVAIWRYLWPRSPAPDQRVVPFFVGLIPTSLVLAMGWNTPIYLWVFEHVPGFAYFQAPARLLIWYTVAVSVLAGVGAQSFTRQPGQRSRWGRLLAVALALIIAAGAGSQVLSGRATTFWTSTLTLGIGLVLAGGLLLLHPDEKLSYPLAWWQGAALGLITFDLLLFAYPLNPTLPPAIFRQAAASAQFLQAQPGYYRFYVADSFEHTVKFNRFFRFDTFGPRQLDHWQELRELLLPNLGVYAGLPSANNDDPLVVARRQRLTDQLGQANPAQRARLLGLMNVAYLIDDPAQSDWPILYRQEPVLIRRVPEPLPRAYFVTRAHPARDQAEAIARLTGPDFEPGQEVVIMKGEGQADLPPPGQGAAPSQPGSVEIRQAEPGRVTLAVEAPAAGFVVLTDTYYPGWRAAVDGRPAPIWVANLAFRAVAVEAGAHRVEFTYRPRSFSLGLGTSIITLVIMAAILLAAQRKHS